jgi:hypothetical protein
MKRESGELSLTDKVVTGVSIVCFVGLLGTMVMTLTGCVKRAPTSYELDKRSGLGTPPPDPSYEHPKRYQRRAARKARRHGEGAEPSMRSTSLVAPTPRMPARTTPVVRRIWVADQNLSDGSWLQGTWWVVEVEPSRWLHEVDPGGAWFAEPVPVVGSINDVVANDVANASDVDGSSVVGVGKAHVVDDAEGSGVLR